MPLDFKLLHQIADQAHEMRRQAFGRFVQQQHLGIAHHGAGDGEHLLFAAGEESAAPPLDLPQPRHELVDAGERPANVLRPGA